MTRSIFSRAAMALAALFVLAPAAPALAGDGPDGVCRTDRYFVHVPTFADASVVPGSRTRVPLAGR